MIPIFKLQRCCIRPRQFNVRVPRYRSDSTTPLHGSLVRSHAIKSRRHVWHSPWMTSGHERLLSQSIKYNAETVDDTIFALSTPAGTSAIAVIRISGPACVDIYKALCPGKPLPKARYASLRTLYEPALPQSSDTILDPGALLLYFPAPNTVTGDDVLELHVHGGPATVKAVLGGIPRSLNHSYTLSDDSSSAPSRIRYADPGEFTRRAFMNARLSLPQVEALSATLTAQTEQQRRIAARGSTSSLSNIYQAWRTLLLNARGELEALIDFSEDQHFDESPRELTSNVARVVADLHLQISAHRDNAVRGELLRNGISVALLGAPNVGKSSLLNRIVGREAAIVSRVAGTTRDVVEVGVDIDGWLVKLGDTAGLRGGGIAAVRGAEVGEVELEGIRRAKDRAMRSDVVIVVFSIEKIEGEVEFKLCLDPEVVESAKQCLAQGRSLLVAVNKTDKIATSGRLSARLSALMDQVRSELPSLSEQQIFAISCEADSNETVPSSSAATLIGGRTTIPSRDTGNIQSLLRGLTNTFSRLTQPIIPDAAHVSLVDADHKEQSDTVPDMSIWQDSLGASERQRLLLEKCMAHLESFLGQSAAPVSLGADVEEVVDIVVAAESLRAAAECLAKITGRGDGGDVEEVLGVVFEKFCVGK